MKNIVVLLFLCIIITQAQSLQPSIHKVGNTNAILGSPGFPAPIRPGNMWVYQDSWGIIDSYRVSENTRVINGNIFYQTISEGIPIPVFERYDTSGYYESWRPDFYDSLTVKYYKPHAAIGDIWKYPTPYNMGGYITHTVVNIVWMSTLYFDLPDCRVIRPTADSATFIDDLEVWSDSLGLIMSRRYDEGEYNLVACRINGKVYGSAGYIQTGINDAVPRKPGFQLDQNYPNPFNPSTQLSFSLPEKAHVSLAIYNSLGKLVSQLTDQVYEAGNHSLSWNAGSFPSGIYFCVMKANAFTASKKLILVK